MVSPLSPSASTGGSAPDGRICQWEQVRHVSLFDKSFGRPWLAQVQGHVHASSQ